jgi:hypothetical protein
MDKLKASSALAPYGDDSDSTSQWGVRTKRDGFEVSESYFGVALTPRGEKLDDTDNGRVDRRLKAGWQRIQPKDDDE